VTPRSRRFEEREVGGHSLPRLGDGVMRLVADHGVEIVFEEMVYQYSILEAVKEGWLAEPKGYRILTHISLADVGNRNGDFASGELASVVDNPIRADEDREG
jgi:hypothetical protein